MIIDVKQTKTVGENEFQISVDGVLKYIGNSPWLSIGANGFDMNNAFSLRLKTTQGNEVFHTKYDVLQNFTESLTRAKWLFGQEARSSVLTILDNADVPHGEFYESKQGWLDNKFAFGYNGRTFLGYFKATGKQENISIYDDSDAQIAQIVKNIAVVIDNLDEYRIYLKNEHWYLAELLSLFTIYFDARRHSHSGEIVYKKKQFNYSVSFDKNDHKYNPNWIAENFGAAQNVPPQAAPVPPMNYAAQTPATTAPVYQASQTPPPYAQYDNNQPRKRKIPLAVKIIGGIFAGIAILIILLVSILGSTAKMETITLGDDRIPTLYGATGYVQKVSSYSTSIENGITTKEIVYRDSIMNSILEDYVDFLKDGGFTVLKNDGSGGIQLGKLSRDSGQVILINIRYEFLNLQIAYRKGNGTLPSPDKDTTENTPAPSPSTPFLSSVGTQTIGEIGYGYLDVPESWVEFKDTGAVPGAISYCDGTSDVTVQINVFRDKPDWEVWNDITDHEEAKVDWENIGTTYGVNLAGFDANEIASRYPDGSVLMQWVFTSDSDTTRYLALKCPMSDYESYLDIIKSYRLTYPITETQTIGKAGYGYMDIPKNWIEFRDANPAPGVISYCDGTPYTIIHMNTIDDTTESQAASALLEYQKSEVGEDNVSWTFETLAGFDAYEIISHYPDDSILIQWIFDGDYDEDSSYITYYLALECPASDYESYLDIIKSYRLG